MNIVFFLITFIFGNENMENSNYTYDNHVRPISHSKEKINIS